MGQVQIDAGVPGKHEIRVDLKYPLAPLTVSAKGDTGYAVIAGSVRVASRGVTESKGFAYGLNKYVFWVPKGQVAIDVSASRYEPARQIVDVVWQVGGPPAVVDVVLTRAGRR
jgi:hypothetical protein